MVCSGMLLNQMDNKKRFLSFEGKLWRGRNPKANSLEGESHGGSLPPAVKAELSFMGQSVWATVRMADKEEEANTEKRMNELKSVFPKAMSKSFKNEIWNRAMNFDAEYMLCKCYYMLQYMKVEGILQVKIYTVVTVWNEKNCENFQSDATCE